MVYDGTQTETAKKVSSASFESCAVYDGPNPTTGVQRKAISLRAERFTMVLKHRYRTLACE